MKLLNNIRYCAASLLVLACVFSCRREELKQANAVAAEYATMTFEAVGAEPQELPVYADGTWTVECAESWVILSQYAGSGAMDITVSVEDNKDGAVVDFPREAKIYFKGSSVDPNQNGIVVIRQKGDSYKGKPELAVADFLRLDDEELCKLAGVTVAALSDEGFVAYDETGCIYVNGDPEELALGSKAMLSGKKATVNGIPAMQLDVINVTGKDEAAYPEAKDITAGLDTYDPQAAEFVSVEGSIAGFVEGKLLADAVMRVTGRSKEITLLNQRNSMQLGELNYHKVVADAYSVGQQDGSPVLIIVSIKEDKGYDESVVPVTPVPGAQVFFDDFSWLDPIVEAYRNAGGKVGDTVGEANTGADAPNIWNIAALKAAFEPLFMAKGYTDLNPSEKLCYLQDGYLKFSKTGGHNTALQLKVAALPPAPTDVDITFDYCMMVQGDGTVDAGPVGVVIIGDGCFANGTKVSDGNVSKQKKGQFLWNKTSVMKAQGVTSRTKFVFLMQRVLRKDADGQYITDAAGNFSLDWAVSGAGRFFIDNIDIKVSGPDVDPEYADIKTETKLLTFEGTGGEQTVKITSDHDFRLEASEDWITFDKTAGAAGEETEINVICAQSELSVLRKAVITVISADSTMDIPVVQSAAGQDIDPFISISKSNVSISAKANEVTVNVQSNAKYNIVSDASWVTLKQPETAPAAMVEKTSVTFTVDENTDKNSSRVAHVVFSLEGKDIEAVLNITQDAAQPDDPDLLFSDDFSWISPFVAEYNKTKTVADFVNGTYATLAERIDASNNNSPNMYSTFGDYFAPALAAAGYTDLNASAKVIYAQGTEENPYLKFCKGNTQGGIAFSPLTESHDMIKVSVDWAIHMTNSALDAVHLQFKLQGDGQFLNGTQTSEPLECSQKAVGDVMWTHSEVVIAGASANTIIAISNKEGFDGSFKASGQHRFYIDNIEVRKVTPLYAEWSFTADTMGEYKDLFGGTAGVVSLAEGFGTLSDNTDMRVPSTVKKGGNIYYYQVDKTSTTPTSGNPKRIVGGTGDPYITGGWPGDYWLFTLSDGTVYPAGTKLEIDFLTKVSATGHKYAIAEYWDGEAWQPVYEMQEETETGTSAQYNFIQSTTDGNVKAVWTLAKDCEIMQFRLKTSANWQQKGGALANPNGGTCRITKYCKFGVVTE